MQAMGNGTPLPEHEDSGSSNRPSPASGDTGLGAVRGRQGRPISIQKADVKLLAGSASLFMKVGVARLLLFPQDCCRSPRCSGLCDLPLARGQKAGASRLRRRLLAAGSRENV